MSDRTRPRLNSEIEQGETAAGAGVAIIGVGAVGSGLARSLYRTNYRLLALVNRSKETAERLAAETGSPIVSDRVADIPPDAKLLFICTREEDIPAVVDDLLATDLDFKLSVVAHVSGRLDAAILSPLATRGARTLSFHPLGSFPPAGPSKTFEGLTIGIEGDPLAVAVGTAVALDLGAIPVEIPAEAKAAYHLAAAMASNYLVTLMGDVQRLLTAVDLPLDLTDSLIEDTLENLRSATPGQALTGPIVRADDDALVGQIGTLIQIAPELLSRFIALAEGTIDLAERSGRISAEESAGMRKILEEAGRP